MRPPPHVPRNGVVLLPRFVSPAERQRALAWLAELHPLWERRFSTLRPLPPGEAQRWLKRPVYWLGNWQFACLGYYHPPQGVVDRCVRAEPFPETLAAWAGRIEERVRRSFPAEWIPRGWAMNTCLVNFYGNAVAQGKAEDRARVGAHRDFEPGPVASVSLGARAMFQFATRRGDVVQQMWLEDSSLQLFAGPVHKDRLFHRVQRVERVRTEPLPPEIPGFVTRRVNFTFRFVPPEHVATIQALSAEARADIDEWVDELARHSPFWANAR